MKRKRKKVRERGKIKLSEYFKELKKDEKVILKYMPGTNCFPKRFDGKVARVEEKRGMSYVVRFKDGRKIKRLIVKPIYLKRLRK